MGLLDLVADTLDAFVNIAFMTHLTICLWVTIAALLARAIYFRKGLVSGLRQLQHTMIDAHLGNALR